MELSSYTRRLEECRKRWNSRSLQFVLAAARIIRGARRAAKDERRWGQWIREETRMSRMTVHRYLCASEFVRANVTLKRQLAPLGILKIYALSRLRPIQARRLIRSGDAERLGEIEFIKLAARLRPRAFARPSLPNILRSTRAAITRLERSMARWESSDLEMPVAVRLEIQSKLTRMNRALERIRKHRAAAI
jgi:hypothetical protein